MDFLGSAMNFSFLFWNRWDERQQKRLCVIEADTAKLIFTLHAFKFAVQLILFCKEGEKIQVCQDLVYVQCLSVIYCKGSI